METKTEEKIESIKEFERESFAGFIIKTNLQEIKLEINNVRDCCEQFGYFLSEDDLSSFIGAKLLNVTLTDTALKTCDLPEVYEGGTMFVNIVTSNGVLQFVAYNEHNGYYGHEARVSCKQLNYETVL